MKRVILATSLIVTLLGILPTVSADPATLEPWTLTSATNGAFAHNGIAGVPGHLYAATWVPGVTAQQVEVASILPDGSLGPWSITAPLNIGRIYGITLASEGHLYIAGGWMDETVNLDTPTVEVATINPDGSLSPWAFTSPMNIGRGNHAGAVGAGRLYMLSDYAGSSSVESAAILPDGSLSAWRYETSMNQARERPAAAVVGDHLYVIGGLPFTTSVERAHIGADGVLGPWEYVTSTQVQRYQLGAASVGPLLFAVGGYNNGQGFFASVEVAEVVGGSLGPWSYTSTMNRARGNCDVTATDYTLYAVGGEDRTVEFASVVGLDSDGDGVPDEEDCAPDDPVLQQTVIEYPDADGDGVRDSLIGETLCVATGTPASPGTTYNENGPDNCLGTFNPDQLDSDGDLIGDACDPFPQDPDNEQAQCEADLGECVVDLDETVADLAQCDADLLATETALAETTADTDEDGCRDLDDMCPGTTAGAEIDTTGCSLEQFCNAIDVTLRPGKRTCRKSDWRNDQPLMRSRDRDCTVDKGAAGIDDDRCVPRPE